MDEAYILTLDAGTTGVKCAAFSPKGEAACSAVEAYPTYYPFSGWAQQKPGEQLDAALFVLYWKRCPRSRYARWSFPAR